MTDSVAQRLAPTKGVLGIFLVVLGAGAILDGEWWWPGGALIGVGAWLLCGARTRFGGLA